MIILKSERDLEAMRPACAVAGTVLDEVAAFIKPGVTTRRGGRICGGTDQAVTGQKARFWDTASIRARFAFR